MRLSGSGGAPGSATRHPHHLSAGTHTVEMAQVADLNTRLAQTPGPTAAQLGLDSAQVRHGAPGALPGTAVLTAVRLAGAPAFPDLQAVFGGSGPGTGLVVDRLLDMTRLAGEGRTVMRARHDWTVFEKNRTMPLYDNQTFPEWHTLEGPFIRKHAGKYYCFYSGANFLTPRYGVDYCVADAIMGPYSDKGAEKGPRVLAAVAGHVRGPGHHSHVLSPDGKTEYLVYHAWNPAMTERQLCIDKLAWTKQGPRCLGPTFTPQPLPK